MTNSKDAVFSVIAANRGKIKDLGITRVGVFGSFVRGEQGPASDVDLLIEFAPEKKTYRNFLYFAELAEKMLGRRVEVVTPQGLSPYISPHIMREVEYVQIA